MILCEFDIRHQSRVLTYILQCTLPLNELLGRFFFLFWFWLILLILLILLNAGIWLVRLMCGSTQTKELRQQLLAMGVASGELGGLDTFKQQRIQVSATFYT